MEAFESFVAIAMESEGLVVSEAIKFPVTRKTAKAAHDEVQTHGYEVDLIGACGNSLILATVKSYFGSGGVKATDVDGSKASVHSGGYRLLHDPVIRDGVVSGAATRFGYDNSQIELRLYVGRFAGPKQGKHEARIREWCASQTVGSGPIKVVGLHDVVKAVRGAAAKRQYRDNQVLVTMKVLEAAGVLTLELPEDLGTEPAPVDSPL